MLSLKDVVLDAVTTRLLHAAGAQDAAKGVNKYSGWKVVAAECGYDQHHRTPAEEAYLDGYFGVKLPEAQAPKHVKVAAPKSASRWKPQSPAKPKPSLRFTLAEQRIFEEALSQL